MGSPNGPTCRVMLPLMSMRHADLCPPYFDCCSVVPFPVNLCQGPCLRGCPFCCCHCSSPVSCQHPSETTTPPPLCHPSMTEKVQDQKKGKKMDASLEPPPSIEWGIPLELTGKPGASSSSVAPVHPCSTHHAHASCACATWKHHRRGMAVGLANTPCFVA